MKGVYSLDLKAFCITVPFMYVHSHSVDSRTSITLYCGNPFHLHYILLFKNNCSVLFLNLHLYGVPYANIINSYSINAVSSIAKSEFHVLDHMNFNPIGYKSFELCINRFY